MPTREDVQQERDLAGMSRELDRYESELWQMARIAGQKNAFWRACLADHDYQRKLHFEKVRQQNVIAQITERGTQRRQTMEWGLTQEREALGNVLGGEPASIAQMQTKRTWEQQDIGREREEQRREGTARMVGQLWGELPDKYKSRFAQPQTQQEWTAIGQAVNIMEATEDEAERGRFQQALTFQLMRDAGFIEAMGGVSEERIQALREQVTQIESEKDQEKAEERLQQAQERLQDAQRQRARAMDTIEAAPLDVLIQGMNTRAQMARRAKPAEGVTGEEIFKGEMERYTKMRPARARSHGDFMKWIEDTYGLDMKDPRLEEDIWAKRVLVSYGDIARMQAQKKPYTELVKLVNAARAGNAAAAQVLSQQGIRF